MSDEEKATTRRECPCGLTQEQIEKYNAVRNDHGELICTAKYHDKICGEPLASHPTNLDRQLDLQQIQLDLEYFQQQQIFLLQQKQASGNKISLSNFPLISTLFNFHLTPSSRRYNNFV